MNAPLPASSARVTTGTVSCFYLRTHDTMTIWGCESGFFEKTLSLPQPKISKKTSPNVLTRFPRKSYISAFIIIKIFWNPFSSLREILISKFRNFENFRKSGKSWADFRGKTTKKCSQLDFAWISQISLISLYLVDYEIFCYARYRRPEVVCIFGLFFYDLKTK